MGAADYLVKPVRVQECKAFKTKMKRRELTPQSYENQELRGLSKYKYEKPLGQGAAGTVSVYKSKLDGQLYAVKEIDLTFMSAKDKKASENEIQFLKVLKGPTIVKFYEAFTEG